MGATKMRRRCGLLLHHLQVDPQLPHARTQDCAAQQQRQQEFPVGFSSHGPDKDVDPAAARRIGLSAAETAFFKQYGFIAKRGLMPKAELAPWVE